MDQAGIHKLNRAQITLEMFIGSEEFDLGKLTYDLQTYAQMSAYAQTACRDSPAQTDSSKTQPNSAGARGKFFRFCNT